MLKRKLVSCFWISF